MATTYVYTGDYRAKTLDVVRLDTNAKHTYNFLNSFTLSGKVYPAITANELAIMSETDYQTRLAAFYSWVETQEIGLNVASINIAAQYAPYGTDATSCPIGTVYTPV